MLAIQVFLDTYATLGIRAAIAREVLRTYSIANFERDINRADTQLLVAEHNEHLVGFAQITFPATQPLAPTGAQAELLRLYVQEPFTERKLGTRLLAEVERGARESGANVLWLTPWVHNARARAFYARRGYVDCGLTYFEFEGERHENRVVAKALVP